MQDDTDDVQLVEGIARQSHQDFAEFVNRYMLAIMNFIHRYIHNYVQVEDIAQDVFLNVWQHAAQWQAKPNGSPRAWLYRIAYNRSVDVIRQQKSNTNDIENLVTHITPEKILSDDNKQQQVALAMQGLPESQRTALYLYTYQGLSNKEAADTLDISVEALESLLSRARRQLRKQLTPNSEVEHDGEQSINE